VKRYVCYFSLAVAALLATATLISHSAMAQQITGVNTPPGTGQVLNLGTQGNIYMTIDASGNVGIGVTIPPYTLTVAPGGAGSGLGISWNKSTGGTGETDFYNYAQGGPGGFAFYNYPAPGAAYPTSGATNLMTILSNGNVGIGTPTPLAALDVYGNSTAKDLTLGVWSGSASYNGIYLNGLSAAPGSYNILSSNSDQTLYINRPLGRDMHFRENNVDQVVIQNTTGNVGIGVATPAQKLSVAGTIQSTSGGVQFPDGTVQTTAASAPPGGHAFGGGFAQFVGGGGGCQSPNGLTGGCSCPAGTAVHSFGYGNGGLGPINMYLCY
jgi:hypothetical protein